MKRLFPAFLVLLIGLVCGCSGFKTYPNDLEKNLVIRTTASGSLFTSVDVFLHIYDSTKDCKKGYLGTMKLKNGETQVGIPAGRPTSLDLVFRAGNGFTHKKAVFTFRPGVHYIADVSYVDRIYNYSIHEAGPYGKPGHEIQGQPWSCPE